MMSFAVSSFVSGNECLLRKVLADQQHVDHVSGDSCTFCYSCRDCLVVT